MTELELKVMGRLGSASKMGVTAGIRKHLKRVWISKICSVRSDMDTMDMEQIVSNPFSWIRTLLRCI